MPGAAPPLVVVEGPAALADAALALERAGWRVRRGFEPPERTWDLRGLRVVCAGQVRAATDVSAALLAASRGTGLIADVEHAGEALGGFVEDLRHVGPVQLRHGRSEPLDSLESDERRALEILGRGGSLDDAARELGYSRRTVSRKLARARDALGARTNAEAVLLVADRRATSGRSSSSPLRRPGDRARTRRSRSAPT